MAATHQKNMQQFAEEVKRERNINHLSPSIISCASLAYGCTHTVYPTQHGRAKGLEEKKLKEIEYKEEEKELQKMGGKLNLLFSSTAIRAMEVSEREREREREKE